MLFLLNMDILFTKYFSTLNGYIQLIEDNLILNIMIKGIVVSVTIV